jgi:hypothetical protein
MAWFLIKHSDNLKTWGKQKLFIRLIYVSGSHFFGRKHVNLQCSKGGNEITLADASNCNFSFVSGVKLKLST